MYDIDQFLRNTSILTEGKQVDRLANIISGEVFKGIVKKYLPKTAAKYGEVDNELLIFRKLNMKAKPNTELNKYIKSQIDSSSKGVTIKSYILKEKQPNAFTIPGVYLDMSSRDMTLSKMMFGSYSAKKFAISGDVSNSGKAILNSSTKVTPLIVMTSGLNNDKLYTLDEKMAILMHEVGHWSDSATSKQFPQSILAVINMINVLALSVGLQTTGIAYRTFYIMVSLLFIFLVSAGMLSRSAEFAADAFAKKVGKGKELSDALQKMGGDSPVKDKEELDAISNIFDKISPITDFISLSTHPSVYRRSGRLLEDAAVLQEGKISDLSDDVLDKIMKPIMSKLDNLITSRFRPMLWAYSSK